ncbi:MAG: hypothetical protein OXC61_08590 [Flavobacteriaceae bacterium]|nr:hypothetical protein [Flavobacteriaceae bacterium]
MKRNPSEKKDELIERLKKTSNFELSAEDKREQRISYAMSCVGDYSPKGRKMAEEAVKRIYG